MNFKFNFLTSTNSLPLQQSNIAKEYHLNFRNFYSFYHFRKIVMDRSLYYFNDILLSFIKFHKSILRNHILLSYFHSIIIFFKSLIFGQDRFLYGESCQIS